MIRRALERARRDELATRGAPPPIAGSPGLSRRALLTGLGGAGAAALLPRRAEALPRGARVAIVGGGIAGLTALDRLAEAGVDARVYEARNRLGGRMFTGPGFDGGKLEHGAQLVNSDHQEVRGLCARFGVGLVDRKATPHTSLVLSNGAVVEEAVLARALAGIAAQIMGDADRLDRDFARNAPALDRLSVAQYLDRHAGLIAEPWVRPLLEMSIRTEFGAEPDEVSALSLIFNLPTVEGQRVEVLGGSDERFVIQGGSGALIDAMASKHDGKIETGKRLARIARERGGVRLSFLDGSGASADAVIVAVPAPIMRQIDYALPLPAAMRALIAEARLGRNEKLHVETRARPWIERQGLAGELWQTDPAAGFALGWDGTIGSGTAGVWTGFMGGDQTSAAREAPVAALAERFIAAAAPAVPGLPQAATGQARRTNWHRDALTLGAYSNFAPGQLTRFAPLFWAERQGPVFGPVAFAGEHLSDAWAGFMNGAAETGRLAAETLIGVERRARAA